MAILKTFALLLLISLPTMGQFVIKEITADSTENETITIESSLENSESKSEWGAALMSLALPGTGHFYLGEKKRGTAFLSVDLTLIAGTILSEATSRRIDYGSMDYARRYASTNSSRGREDKYWNDIGNHDSTITDSDDWNQSVDKYRDPENRYDGEDVWEWRAMSQKNSYIDQRDRADKWHVASLVMVGGLVVNRLVSFVDARRIARKHNANLFTGVQVYPSYTTSTETMNITIVGAF